MLVFAEIIILDIFEENVRKCWNLEEIFLIAVLASYLLLRELPERSKERAR